MLTFRHKSEVKENGVKQRISDKEINKMSFRNEIAKEIESIETRKKDVESRLDYMFDNFTPEDDGVMEAVMSLSEYIVNMDEKLNKLKETFWKLV